MATEFASREAELEATAEPTPAFTLVGFRHLGTGVLRTVENGLDSCPEGWEPVFTGGPEVIQPVIDVALALARDRTEGVERRARRWLDLRFDMQRALGKFVELGAHIP